MNHRSTRKLATFESLEYRRLQGIIRRVRNRWRLRVILRGLGLLLVAGLATLMLISWGLDAFRYRPWAVGTLSVLAYGVIAVGVWSWLLRPLSRRVGDREIALYVEERADLRAALLSAVEFGALDDRPPPEDVSPLFVEKLVEQAVQQGPEIGYGKAVDRDDMRRVSGLLGAASMAVLAVVLVNPAFLRHGAMALLNPFSSETAASVYAVDVLPGDADVARGGDQLVTAGLVGFDSDEVQISFRIGEGDWEREPMSADVESGRHEFLLFRLEESTEYFIEASGVRSDVYTLEVVDLPYVERIDLELIFPEYSGLSPQRVEDGGDIAALTGTRARLRITPTVEVPAGSVRLEWLRDRGDQVESALESVPLTVVDGTMEAEITVEGPGYYRIELQDFAGQAYEASAEYLIEALADQPPTLTFDAPGRDVTVTPIEEVFTEISAEDDFGLARVEIVYTVNGGERRSVPIGSAVGRKSTTGAHTFYLEEEELEPGDFVAYWAEAADQRGAMEPAVTTTDIFFMEVRPFAFDYRQADSGGGGGGGGGMPGMGLADRQREVVAATFKLIRDRERSTEEQIASDLDFLAGIERELRGEVTELMSRFNGVGDPEESMRGVDYLSEASKALGESADELEGRDAESALVTEQRALQQLQRFEALFREMQVSMNQGGQGGGGGGDMQALEDMFDLEMDELRNQYESVRRGEQEEADNAVDEAMQRLTELARRQQQEIERQRAQGGAAQGRRGGGQREIAGEAEELARQLERLARRNSERELQEAANRLRDAADAMRRAAANGGDSSSAEGARALSELQNARRLLDDNRGSRLERDLRDARNRIAEMRQAQEAIEREVDQLGTAGGRTPERMERLLDRKDRLAGEIRDLERQLDNMARESRTDQMETSRRLQEAAEWIRDGKLADKVRYSKGVVQERDSRYVGEFEEGIGDDLERVDEMIAGAAGSVEESSGERMTDALDETRDLVRRLESFEERAREAAEQGGDRRLGERPSDEPGDEGRPGEAGEGGQEAGQGAEGQAGQEGRQGGPGEQQQGEGQQAAGSAQAGGASSGVPGRRQLGREFRERLDDAMELREMLAEEGLQTTDLDRVIAAMRDFDEEFSGTTRGLDELESEVIDGLKLFEFWLRRVTEAETGTRPQLAGSDRVPEGYRALVEEYFRALAREEQR